MHVDDQIKSPTPSIHTSAKSAPYARSPPHPSTITGYPRAYRRHHYLFPHRLPDFFTCPMLRLRIHLLGVSFLPLSLVELVENCYVCCRFTLVFSLMLFTLRVVPYNFFWSQWPALVARFELKYLNCTPNQDIDIGLICSMYAKSAFDECTPPLAEVFAASCPFSLTWSRSMHWGD